MYYILHTMPDELELPVDEWVDYYNNRRYHESLRNITPADQYFGRGAEIFEERRCSTF